MIPHDSVILDDEVEAVFKEYFDTLLKPLGGKRATFTPKIYLLANTAVNAASASGGQFLIYAGLFRMCDTVEEFLGVIAHEIAHGKGVHSVQAAVGADKAFMTAAIAFALGGIAALAAKDAAPLMAGVTGGQNAYMGSVMRNMQNLEKAADAEAIKILSKAGIPATGLLTFLVKLQKAYGAPDISPYFLDHPLTEDRIQAVEHDVKQTATLPWLKRAAFQSSFERIRTKILAFTLDPKSILKMFPGKTANDSYARAVAYGRTAQTRQGLEEIDQMLKLEPQNSYALELKSQLLMDIGQKNESIEALRKAVSLKPQAIYLKMSLAHLLVEQQQHLPEAIHHLTIITQKAPESDFAWHLLGKVYMANGQEGHALLANAESDALKGDRAAAKAKVKSARLKANGDKALLQKINDLEKSLG